MNKVYTTSTFARKLGFKTASDKRFRRKLKRLVSLGSVEVQQGGFKADSMHHPKLVVIKRKRFKPKLIPKRINETPKRSESYEFIDYCGIVEGILSYVPKEIVNEKMINHIFAFVFYFIDNPHCFMVKSYAQQFLKWYYALYPTLKREKVEKIEDTDTLLTKREKTLLEELKGKTSVKDGAESMGITLRTAFFTLLNIKSKYRKAVRYINTIESYRKSDGSFKKILSEVHEK